MIAPTSGVRVLMATKPVHFRKGANGRLRLGAPPPTPPKPSEHLRPVGERLRQHIITKHHQHTKPVQLQEAQTR